MMLTDPDAAKRVLRTVMRAARAATGHDATDLVAQIRKLALPQAATVAGVWPLPGEPDLVAAWTALHARGHVVVLPETTPRGEALLFRRWEPGGLLRDGRFGTRHPDGPVQVPDIVFVPLLAWDRQLRRLGYGGGYYDRTLAALPEALAIGVGLSVQEVAAVPVGPYDVALDAVVTERGLLTAEGRDLADIVSGRHRRAQRT
jgi:5-formyltetrahydrofolate cyclo-ligase